MKNTLKSALIATVLLFANANTFAQSYPARTLVLTNNTNDELTVAYAYQDITTGVWTSHGWIKIMALSKTSIQIGSATKPTFFIHAHDRNGDLWGGDNYFCTTKEAFDIPNADKSSCGNKKRFRPIVLKDKGETDYSLQH